MMEYTASYKNAAKLSIYKNKDGLAAGFFDLVTDLVSERLAENKPFSIALSGGSTPLHIYRYMNLIKNDFRYWDKLKIYWGDERCVPPDDRESNFGNAWISLLKNLNIPAENIKRMKGEEEPELACRLYIQELESLEKRNGTPALDLIILGLGEDGHTASIFPDQMNLLKADEWVSVASHPQSGQKRLSLTGNVINNAKHILFLASGTSKQIVLKNIFTDQPIAKNYPAYHIRPHSGKLYWLLDEEAGKHIV